MDLSMSLNCSFFLLFNAMNSAEFMSDFAADYFDSMSDYLEEQQESIRETDQSDWEFIDSTFDDLSP